MALQGPLILSLPIDPMLDCHLAHVGRDGLARQRRTKKKEILDQKISILGPPTVVEKARSPTQGLDAQTKNRARTGCNGPRRQPDRRRPGAARPIDREGGKIQRQTRCSRDLSGRDHQTAPDHAVPDDHLVDQSRRPLESFHGGDNDLPAEVDQR
jgi:hypothetical protein